ncbi:MAG: pheT [Rickettsiaceae bacterium]|jgi:phenylalanyl-tRNA synthetase beta chain|nr:pheT [Rickettsiaceae bacterium]
MKFTLSWLKTFLDTESSLQEICERLTILGLEVEEVIDRAKDLGSFKVAEILEAEQHPNADKLRVCKVNNGSQVLQIVCGAPNARAGIKVVLAEVGVLIPNGEFKIKASEIRGVKSEGMLCSEDELKIGGGSEGIIELPTAAIAGESFLKYYGMDDPVIEIAVTPNRGDCLGVYGIARDLAASGLGTLKEPLHKSIPLKFTSNFEAKVENSKLSQLFALRELNGVRNCESPTWLKNLLKNIGVTPISALVDITNYISYSFARPLHAYDKNMLDGSLVVREARNGEKLKALNGKEYSLAEGDIVIAGESEIHGLGGIIGGEASSCSSETINVILEAALFDKVQIAKTGRRLQIHTDARFRFERHVDPNFTLQGLDIATDMILGICGGEASEPVIVGDKHFKNKEIDFCFNIIEKKTGLKVSSEESLEILHKLGFKVFSKDAEQARLMIPSWRSDISIGEDLVEEVARIYGYDKLPLAPLPKVDFFRQRLLTQKQRRMRDARKILAARGLDEVVSWSFMASEKAALYKPLIEELYIANPIAAKLDYMRPSIFSNLLEIIVKNKARSFNDLAFFEIGPIFQGIRPNEERQVITAVRTGNYLDKSIYGPAREVDIYDVKADLELLLEEFNFNIQKLQLSSDKPAYFHPNRAASLKLGNKVIAHFGELHPALIANYDIKNRVVGFELFLEELPEARLKFGQHERYSVSDFQPVERDFAFWVGEKVNVGEMTNFIKSINKDLIKEVRIFDIFKGSHSEISKKSVALTVLLQAKDKTLTDLELQDISEKIIREIERKFEAKIRDN